MYKILIFDLDNTLTDDVENTKEALKYVMNLRGEKFSEEKYKRFHKIDLDTWIKRANGEIITPFEDDIKKKTEWIRASRWIKFYGEDSISYEEAVKVNEMYMEGIKLKVVPQDNCYEVIKYLYDKKYRLIIATNGPLIAVDSKLSKLGIKQFIDMVFSAEEVGQTKPHKLYFEGLLKKANIDESEKNNILVIGDDLQKDIKGGIDNGIDTCWCNLNFERNTTEYKAKYEINKLLELKKIL